MNQEKRWRRRIVPGLLLLLLMILVSCAQETVPFSQGSQLNSENNPGTAESHRLVVFYAPAQGTLQRVVNEGVKRLQKAKLLADNITEQTLTIPSVDADSQRFAALLLRTGPTNASNISFVHISSLPSEACDGVRRGHVLLGSNTFSETQPVGNLPAILEQLLEMYHEEKTMLQGAAVAVMGSKAFWSQTTYERGAAEQEKSQGNPTKLRDQLAANALLLLQPKLEAVSSTECEAYNATSAGILPGNAFTACFLYIHSHFVMTSTIEQMTFHDFKIREICQALLCEPNGISGSVREQCLNRTDYLTCLYAPPTVVLANGKSPQESCFDLHCSAREQQP